MKITLKLYLYAFALLLAWPLLAACGSGQPAKMLPADSDVDWAAEANAIVLKFKASEDLNMDMERPSSLAVCVYQLSEERMFEELGREGPKGLETLAACQKFGDAALARKRLFLEPGQRPEPIFLDRLEGVKFVGVAAGYYHLESGRCARVFPVPIVWVKDGWFSGHRAPGQLIIELNFGPDWPEAPTGRGKD